MNQKIAADRAGAASSAQLGAAVTTNYQKISQAGNVLEKLSRQYVTGYAQAAKFEAAINTLGRGIDAGTVPMERASVILEGIYQKFGRTADGAAVAGRGYASLAREVDLFNAKMAATSNTEGRGALSADASRRLAQGMSSVGAAALSAQVQSQRLIQGMSQLNAGFRVTGQSAALSSYAMTNLAFQLNDVATMAAMGADPMRILASQLGQFYQVLATGEGGVRGSIGYLSTTLSAMITPLRLATGGFVALGAAGAAALASAVRDSNNINVALSGVGAASGQTADSINAIASAAAAAGEATAGQARDMLLQFTETGRIGPEISAALVSMSRQFAATFGEDLPEAATHMARAFADPAKGVDDLNGRLGTFDDRTRQAIFSLALQNRTFDAQRLMISEVNKGLVDHADATSRIGRAWRLAVDDMSYYWDQLKQKMKEGVDGPTFEERLAKAQRELSELSNVGHQGLFRNWPASKSEVDAAFGRVQDATRKLNEERRRADEEGRRTEATDLANRAGDLTRKLFPEIDQRRDAEAEGVLLRNAAGAEYVFKHIDELTRSALSRAASMRDAQAVWLEQAIKAGGVAVTTAREEHSLTMASIAARSTAQRAEVAYRQEITRLAREGDPDREERAAMRRDEIYAQAADAAQRANEQRLLSAYQGIEQGRAELALVGQTAEVRARELAMLSVRQQLEAEALRTEGNRNAYDSKHLKIMEERVRWQIELNSRIATEGTLRELAFEREQMGRSEREQTVYGRMDSLGLLTNGEIVGTQAELIAGQIRFNEVMRISQDTSKEFVSGFVHDMKEGRGAVEALSNALNRLADRFIDMALDQSMSALFRPFSEAVATGATGFRATDTLGGWGTNTSLGDWVTSVFHDGGVVGQRGNPTRVVPLSAFASAKRYHQGGTIIGANEVPIIAEKGETVLPKGARAGGGVVVNITNVINAQGAYPESMADIKRELSRTQAEVPRTVQNLLNRGLA